MPDTEEGVVARELGEENPDVAEDVVEDIFCNGEEVAQSNKFIPFLLLT